MKKKILALFLTAVLLLAMATGCGTSTQNTTDTTKATDATTASEAATTAAPLKDSVIIAIPLDMTNLDPHNTASSYDFLIGDGIFGELVDYVDGKYEPDLAESWIMAADGLSYTFKLFKGVKFHNGDELKASDVVFSLNRAKASPYVGGPLGSIKDVSAVDDYTILINLNYQYAPFLSSLYRILMVSEKAVTAAGDSFGQNPIGTGPYKFVEHKTGQSITLTRNDDYFKGPAKIKDVTYRVIPDPSTASIAVETGEVDLAMSVPTISIRNAANNPALKVHSFDSKGLNFIVINNAAKPFDNKLVRQAIAYATDKASIVEIAEDGMGTPAESLFNHLTFGYSEEVKGFPYDIAKAKELLTQAGYPDGFKVKLKTMDGAFKKHAEALQAALGQIGITAEIEMADAAAYTQDIFSGNYEMGVLIIALGMDADDWNAVFASTGAMNFVKYSNPAVDKLFAEAKVATDEATRLAKYKELAQILNDDAPIVPVYFNKMAYVGNKDLKLGYIDPNGRFKAYELSW